MGWKPGKVGWLAAALGFGALACSLFTDLSGLVGDGGSDAASDFQLTVQPSSVVLAAGQNVPITVDIQRASSFAGVIKVVVSGLPPGATANPPILPMAPGTPSAQVTLSAAANVNVGDFAATVIGASNNEVSSAPLAVHVSGVLAAYPSVATASLQVPANVTALRIKAWGAGGGGGGVNFDPRFGQLPVSGGGGGFVAMDLSVTPNDSLTITVGAGGSAAFFQPGGGGGSSRVMLGASNVLIAAGGGGAGWGISGAGGAGGGATGLAGGDVPGCSGTGGSGGTQTANGNAAGGGGGGGGAGLFKGGDGANCPSGSYKDAGAGGGGGGSSFPPDASSSGSNEMPAYGDDPDYADSGAGWGGAGARGKDGRVVVIVP